ncbi:YdcF family protein [Endozoicomonas sp. Mp262]|uniref:YdcF family protein n=1 Tax=Endozoicomonas sp. Mp262 TaxID=2919499 RepID=UPI0021DAC044
MKLKPLFFGLSLASVLAVTGCSSLSSKQAIDYQNQKQVNELVQTGLHYYWHGGDLKKVEQEFFKGITLKGDYDVVAASFAEASQLAPERLDLRFSLASTQIIKKDIDSAQHIYLDILSQDPDNFDAGILHAAYAKVSGNNDIYSEAIASLKENHPKQTREYLEKFDQAEQIQTIKLNTQAQAINNPHHSIVILGYALAKDGSMRPPLVNRLEQGLAAARLNPKASIIVSGGVPHQGVTEAYVMQQWLIKQGVAPERIYLDDKARDTVGNAIYSTDIMADLGTRHVTLISSASHMRRALLVFEETAQQNNLDITFDNLVAMDFDSMDQAMQVSTNEKLVIYRDMMRASGLWAYPGIQI